MNPWLLTYEGYDPAEEGLREALCTLGNGYFATRGALPESVADGVHYPGTYVAGLYNRLSSEIDGRDVENESIVNVPNWLPLRVRIDVDGDDGRWIDEHYGEVLEHRIELDLHRGVLTRTSRIADEAGRIVRLIQRRFVSMASPHVAALDTTIVAENFDGVLTIESGIDGGVTNSGVVRYRDLPSQHLRVESIETGPAGSIGLTAVTTQSRGRVAVAARTRLHRRGEAIEHEITHHEGLAGDAKSAGEKSAGDDRPDAVASRHRLTVSQGDEVTVEKVVALFTGRDDAITDPTLEARDLVAVLESFDQLLPAHAAAWRRLWHHIDVEVGANHDTARLLHLHMFHALATVSQHSVLLDAGVPARGLHGEAYRGHIFWDELFIFPFFSLRLPQLTRSLLLYRYRRLDQARRNAAAAGFRGAMFPWQSSANGREETQTVHLNPKSGRWLPDASHLQRHVNAAVAYNVWHYYQATADDEFLRFFGAEMLIEIARFWSSIATYDRSIDRYSIRGVMGPDEYHEGYPDREEPGLDDNSYTNVMAVWCLCRASEVLSTLAPAAVTELRDRLQVTDEELGQWEDVSTKMRLCFHEGPGGPVLSQFDGFERLAELDWQDYGERYGDIARLDRILEAEGDSPNNYQLAKQADVTMLFYLLTAEELAELFQHLGYEWDGGLIARTIDYYEARTSHGSTLSRVVQAWLHARADRSRSWELFRDALHSDVTDVQGGTTREGIHLGAMASTIDLAQRCYTGIELRGDALRLNPAIPPDMASLALNLRYRGLGVRLHVTDHQVRVAVAQGPGAPICVDVRGDRRSLAAGDAATFDLSPGGAVDPDVDDG